MRNAFSALARLAGILLIICGAVMSFALSPVRLQCEYQTAPLGIDSPHPRLGWWFESSRRGEIQTGYQVVVASSAASLKAGKFDLWDSGKVVSDESVHVEYVGKPLSSNVSCFWKVRLWDRNLKASEWSPTSTWTMGLLNEADWGGKWIAATAEHSYTKSPTMYGYHALEATSAKTEKWVQVDLGSAQAFDEVVLHSPIPPGFSLSDGFGFPIRFMVTVSRDLPGIGQSGLVIANSTQKDCPNPKGSPVHIPCNETFARYVNVIATKLWNRQTGPAPYCFALSEIEVLSKGKNIALHASVTAFDSVENADWNMKRLTDGEYFHAKSLSESSDPQNSAILLRKEVPVKKAVVRATAFLCGLGYSELEINGKKIGDHVLDPGFTDFSKRTLYVTYDVTKSIHPGKNDIRILLGGGTAWRARGRTVKTTAP